VLLAIDAAATSASDADATGGEPIFKDGVGIGRLTLGGYGYSFDISLALGFVKGAKAGDRVEVAIVGRPPRHAYFRAPTV
jgi:dimethylglycine dehydrogenase